MTSPSPASELRQLATQCNNAAWDLIEKPDLTATECGDLVRLASTASHCWGKVGTASNVAHADLLFGWALARAGAAAPAVDAVSRALAYFTQNTSKDWEQAFAHAAMAAARHSAGDRGGHRQSYEEAQRHGAKLASGDEKLFQAAFRNVPKPS